MQMTDTVKTILDQYESDNPGTKGNLARMLMQGKLAGTGRMIILPVDQGFEHGPARSFAVNPDAYDPHYHHRLAIDAGLSAYAAPLGMLEASSGTFAGQIPTILKLNSANSLYRDKDAPTQALTGSVEDALRLGCSAIGYTIYPGSDEIYPMIERLRDLILEAKAAGIAAVVWSYPRGGNVTKEGETGMDVVAYGAHMAALLGAHVIKVKLPTAHLEQKEAKAAFEKGNIPIGSLAERVREVVRSCFHGRRLVVFSGGEAKTVEDVLNDSRAIRDGGGNGQIIGRNSFQRPRAEAMDMLDRMVGVFKGQG